MKLCLTVFAIGCIILPSCFSAKILTVFHVPTRSHYTLGMTLVKELASKGHEVTFVSAFNLTKNIPNVEFIYLDDMYDAMLRCLSTLSKNEDATLLEKFEHSSNFGVRITEAALKNDNMQELLGRNENYDVVILDYLRSEALLGIAAHFQAPLILFSTYSNILVNTFTGNMAPYSFIPHSFLSFTDKMNYFQRFQNTLMRLLNDFIYLYKSLPSQAMLYYGYFNSDRNFYDILNNVSLVLMNTHVILETPKPYMPNMIPIGGFHIKEPKILPKDLQTFLDDAHHGAIFFSFGSNLKASDFPFAKMKIFLDSFKTLKHLKVLWKYENENLAVPSNVLVRKWFPQNEVLAHPNVKLFIFHGGMLSLTEAVYRGVPVISFPFYGDQLSNSLILEKNGFGIQMDFKNFSEKSLAEAIKKIFNDKYQKNAKKMSAIINDQPDHPLNRTMFWIEHVLRHGGGGHLKSSAVQLSWYQYTSMDVVFVIFIVSILILLAVITILTIVLKFSYMFILQINLLYQQILNDNKKNN